MKEDRADLIKRLGYECYVIGIREYILIRDGRRLTFKTVDALEEHLHTEWDERNRAKKKNAG